MEKRTPITLHTGLCAALLMHIGFVQAGSPPASPPVNEVVLTGWLYVEDHTMADVVLEVEVNGRSHMAQVSENGRFTVTLPGEAEVLLRFEKPGHLTKEVLVDTRHAGDGTFGQKTRRVKFAVVMELERHMAGLTYNGPVGSIGFDHGGGCLAVSHDRNMVPARRAKQMVF